MGKTKTKAKRPNPIKPNFSPHQCPAFEKAKKLERTRAVELLRCSTYLSQTGESFASTVAAIRLGIALDSPAKQLATAACDAVGPDVEYETRFLEAAMRLEEGSFP
jgi:hypothetical protein